MPVHAALFLLSWKSPFRRTIVENAFLRLDFAPQWYGSSVFIRNFDRTILQ